MSYAELLAGHVAGAQVVAVGPLVTSGARYDARGSNVNHLELVGIAELLLT